MVLFLFVIMLVNVGAEERGRERIFNSQPQVIATTVFAVLLALAMVVALNQGYRGLTGRDDAKLRAAEATRAAAHQNLPPSATGTFRITKDTEQVGGSLYRYASLPFEIASVLLLVAIIGSVMLARTVKQEAAAGDLDPEELKKQKA